MKKGDPVLYTTNILYNEFVETITIEATIVDVTAEPIYNYDFLITYIGDNGKVIVGTYKRNIVLDIVRVREKKLREIGI
jgi:hypothetical protein